MAADRPAEASRVSPSSPSAPETPSISPSSHLTALNGINVETLRYVVSLGGNSPQKSPCSANPPHYPPLAERRHLPSHPAPRRARLPPPSPKLPPPRSAFVALTRCSAGVAGWCPGYFTISGTGTPIQIF